MQYLSINEIKKQCNVDLDWDGDDEYLEMIGDAAEDTVSELIDCSLEELEAQNGELPSTVRHAMRMLVDYFYSQQRGSSGEAIEIPQSVFTLLKLYRNY